MANFVIFFISQTPNGNLPHILTGSIAVKVVILHNSRIIFEALVHIYKAFDTITQSLSTILPHTTGYSRFSVPVGNPKIMCFKVCLYQLIVHPIFRTVNAGIITCFLNRLTKCFNASCACDRVKVICSAEILLVTTFLCVYINRIVNLQPSKSFKGEQGFLFGFFLCDCLCKEVNAKRNTSLNTTVKVILPPTILFKSTVTVTTIAHTNDTKIGGCFNLLKVYLGIGVVGIANINAGLSHLRFLLIVKNCPCGGINTGALFYYLLDSFQSHGLTTFLGAKVLNLNRKSRLPSRLTKYGNQLFNSRVDAGRNTGVAFAVLINENHTSVSSHLTSFFVHVLDTLNGNVYNVKLFADKVRQLVVGAVNGIIHSHESFTAIALNGAVGFSIVKVSQYGVIHVIISFN
nr:MAG TPA: hypothetical protein [Caudoviricetes sp.]